MIKVVDEELLFIATWLSTGAANLLSSSAEAILILSYFCWQYHEVWAIDEKDPLMKPEGGESVDDVASRLVEAIANIESQFQG